MKLTVKDKDFLERLKPLLESKEMSIELKQDGLKRLMLRQNYGDKIESSFNMTRQGVRWRFHRIFSEIYVQSLETLYWVENLFGTELRQKALEIAKERVGLRKKALKMGHFDTCRRQNRQGKTHAYPDVAHISLFCYESARRCSTRGKVYRNLCQISSEFSQTRKHAILISMRLVFQMVLFVHTVTGQGMRTVFKIGRTCCAANVAGVTLG